MILISVKNIFKRFRDKKVINDFSFEFESGKCYAITGSNGQGKTTLINLILGLIYVNQGQIELYTDRIVYVPDKVNLPGNAKVYEYLKTIGSVIGVNKRQLNHDLDILMKYWKLNEYQDFKIKNLSKGNKQKILITQALIGPSDIYIFDEAMNGLDMEFQQKFIETIKLLKDNGKTVIVITHQLQSFKSVIDQEITL